MVNCWVEIITTAVCDKGIRSVRRIIRVKRIPSSGAGVGINQRVCVVYFINLVCIACPLQKNGGFWRCACACELQCVLCVKFQGQGAGENTTHYQPSDDFSTGYHSFLSQFFHPRWPLSKALGTCDSRESSCLLIYPQKDFRDLLGDSSPRNAKTLRQEKTVSWL